MERHPPNAFYNRIKLQKQHHLKNCWKRKLTAATMLTLVWRKVTKIKRNHRIQQVKAQMKIKLVQDPKSTMTKTTVR